MRRKASTNPSPAFGTFGAVPIKWVLMGPLIRIGERALVGLALLTLIISATYAQPLPIGGQCVPTAVPFTVRSEGLAERLGDIILQCSGSNPGATGKGNFTVFLPVSVTNRIDSNNMAIDAVFSVDYGLGFVTVPVQGLVSNRSISFNGVTITVPANGIFGLKISNIRGNVNQLGSGGLRPVTAGLSFPLQLTQAQLTVANAITGFYSTLYSKGVTCSGSPLPTTIDLSDLFTAHTIFFSTRATEGFASAFTTRGTGDDTGTRFLVKYTGFPANAHLYVPDMVAGSDALTPTSGGDLGLPQAVGQYVPGSGTLLLVRVQSADATGAGGTPLPTPTGSSPVTLNSVSEVTLTNGAGYAVYEVADANPNLIETAQFPTFLGLDKVDAPSVAYESISMAPVSTVGTASSSAPNPRFAATDPASDCSILGDCQAGYFPKLAVQSGAIQLFAIAGGAMLSPPGYIPVQNVGGGIMNWTAIVSYTNGLAWILLDQSTNQNNGSVRVFATPQALAPGTYQANIVIDAGPLAGSATIPVTLTVQALTPPPPPKVTVTVKSVVNAATFSATPLVAGSLATILGSSLGGKNVSVTFDDLQARLLYTSDTQINLQVPDGLGSKTSASLVVTADGISSTAQTVMLAPAWPAIFAHGVLNQDNHENTAAVPAAPGTVLQIFATGIPTAASVSAQIQDRTGLVPLYAGPAPNVPGVQQVNVAIPEDIAPQTAQLVLCAAVGGKAYCSPGTNLYIH
ncbi:MAG: hypothetical protein C5B51_01410 [Terriglobia bacterium]|nr:MAG: hypothetical protein C5B51_01410 [Terriglobia bacterium]